MRIKEDIILTFVLLLIIDMSSCASAREMKPIREIFIDRPDSVQLIYLDDPDWWDYDSLVKIKKEVENYLLNNNVEDRIAFSLRKLQITIGMKKGEVLLLVGKPFSKNPVSKNLEEWLYKGKNEGILSWYYGWGKLYFQNDILVKIELQNVKYNK